MSKERRRRYGSFYTPPPVAEALTRWAVRSGDDTVFDPSYGGCAFFEAALKVLDGLNCESSACHIYGVDLDEHAKGFLTPLLERGAAPDQFIESDFFDVAPDAFAVAPFSAVVGNPPFIRYHRIPPESKERAVAALARDGWAISGRSSFWAYFLLYAIRFLKPGGRLAMILPGAFLQTDYAEEVRTLLTGAFRTVYLFPIQERLFEDTDEEAVAVCAEGAHDPGPAPVIRVGEVANAQGLACALAAPLHHTRPFEPKQNAGGWLRALLPPDAAALYDNVAGSDGVVRLRDVVVPRIGVVTGNNQYFILNEVGREREGLPREMLRPVVRKLAHLPGLIATAEDVSARIARGDRALLFVPPGNGPLPKPVRAYIERGEAEKVHDAYKCRIREPWYVVPHTETPPAFIHCMTAAWPRIVVNQSGATCTNNIVRLDWRPSLPLTGSEQYTGPQAWYPLALGILSTLSQLSAELVGRSYGGGILKVEPGEMARLAIPLLPHNVAVEIAPRADALLRAGRPQQASTLVDDALASMNVLFAGRNLQALRQARNALFMRRRQHRRDASRIVASYQPP
jgi:adenine-specific DNA-methyltransferase